MLPNSYEALAWTQLQRLDLDNVFGAQLSRPLEYRWSSAPFVGNVCVDPDHLDASQRIPHVDQGTRGDASVVLEPQLAVLHYLTDWSATPGDDQTADPTSGGTGF